MLQKKVIVYRHSPFFVNYAFCNFVDSKRKELLETLDGICDYYKATSKQNCSESVIFIESQIDKVEERKKSLITMFADGNITRDEFSVMKAEYNEEIKKALRTERTSERAREHYEWLYFRNICGCQTAWQNA